MKDKPLIEKICWMSATNLKTGRPAPKIGSLNSEHVREAIQRLKEEINDLDLSPEASIQDYLVEAQDRIDKIFGDFSTGQSPTENHSPRCRSNGNSEGNALILGSTPSSADTQTQDFGFSAIGTKKNWKDSDEKTCATLPTYCLICGLPANECCCANKVPDILRRIFPKEKEVKES